MKAVWLITVQTVLFINFLCLEEPYEHYHFHVIVHMSICVILRPTIPEAHESELLLKVALLIARPADLNLLWVQHDVVMKADRVPARHDIEGDDTAQWVRDNRHLPTCLKVWIPRAEEGIQAVQFLSQTSGDLQTHNSDTCGSPYMWRTKVPL